MLVRLILLLLLTGIAQSCSEATPSKYDRERASVEKAVSDSLKGLLESSTIPRDSVESLINGLVTDSLKSKLYLRYAYHFYKHDDSLNFKFWNQKALDFAVAKRDTLSIAISFWDLGNFYNQRHYNDSSYYYYNRAYNLYDVVGEDFLAGRMLLNMGIMQKKIRDYSGSEVTTIRAIEKFKPLDKKDHLYKAYNNLGIIYNELGEFEESFQYHNTALRYQQENTLSEASSLNNIGVVLKNSGKYREAIGIYRKALSLENLPDQDPELYAMLLDNLAHAKLLSHDTVESKKLFYRALDIRDSIGHLAGISINKLHLSEYYQFSKDTARAIEYAREAKAVARTSGNFRDLLDSMLHLAKIDTANSARNLADYISLNDSLQNRERAVRNKFARIRFETDEFIAENEYLNKERKYIYGGGVLAMGVILMVFVNIYQRNRNKQLKLEQDQQKSNEEIYNLLLVQQKKLEEGRNREKNRISRELHDGILSKIFGVRFMLDSLYDKSDEISVKSKKKYIADLKIIEKEIRDISHDLNAEFLSSQMSFLQIVEELLEDQKKAGRFDYALMSDENIAWEDLGSRIKINLYRIIQEAVHNTNKYAEATEFFINLYQEGRRITMILADNGKGFDTQKTGKGIGIGNMKDRMASLEGTIDLNSDSEGTTIKISFPIK